MTYAKTSFKLFLLLLFIPFFLTACDSGGVGDGGDDGGGEQTDSGLPENFQDGWVLQLIGPQGMEYEYESTTYDASGDQDGSVSGSGTLLDQSVYGPWHTTIGYSDTAGLEVDVQYTSGSGTFTVRLYNEGELLDEGSVDSPNQVITLEGGDLP